MKFAVSSLEGSGFETTVPLTTGTLFRIPCAPARGAHRSDPKGTECCPGRACRGNEKGVSRIRVGSREIHRFRSLHEVRCVFAGGKRIRNDGATVERLAASLVRHCDRAI